MKSLTYQGRIFLRENKNYLGRRFYERFSFMWHWFYTTSVRTPFIPINNIFCASTHYFYIRDKKLRIHIKKNERKYDSPYINRRLK